MTDRQFRALMRRRDRLDETDVKTLRFEAKLRAKCKRLAEPKAKRVRMVGRYKPPRVMTQRELGRRLGICQAGVRKIERRALHKLRAAVDQEGRQHNERTKHETNDQSK